MLFCLLFLLASLGAEPVWNPPHQTVSLDHLHMDISLDEKTGRIWGKVSYKMTPLWDDVQKITLDAEEMDIQKVSINKENTENTENTDKTLTYTHQKRHLIITLDKKYTRKDSFILSVFYEVRPRRGIYFVRPDHGYPKKPYQIWTQGQAEDNHYWFPCYDYPNVRSTSDIKVRVRKPYLVISNGVLDSIEEANDWNTYHWKMDEPYVSYLVSLVIGDFVKIEDEAKDVDLHYYVQEKDVAKAMRAFQKTPEMLHLFEEKIGYPYPYKKYAQTPVTDFLFGGMENITSTTLAAHTIQDDRADLDGNHDTLIAHELIHQWFGNWITCRNWSHLWLNEGFATFFEAIWMEHDKGPDYYKQEMRLSYDWYIESDTHSMIWDNYEDLEDIFDSHAYAKGGWVLHMLRDVLGEKDFWRGVQLYVKRNQNRVVTTDDLRYSFEDASGKNLKWFFDQWVVRAGHPKFKASWGWQKDTKMLAIKVEQTQKGELFRVPVNIEIHTSEKSQNYRVWLDQKSSQLYFPCSKEPLLVAFDKGGKVLKEIEFHKENKEWIYQLLHDNDIWGRLAAAKALSKYPEKAALEALRETLVKDSFYAVRQEVAYALGKIESPLAIEALLEGTNDPDALVRAASMSSLGEISSSENTEVILRAKKLFSEDLSYGVQAASLKTLSYLAEEEETEEEREEEIAFSQAELDKMIKEALGMDSPKEIIRSAAIEVLGDIGDDKSLETVKDWMLYGKPAPCRLAAFEAFYEIQKEEQEEAALYLLPYLKDPYVKVRQKSIALLGKLKVSAAITSLIEVVEQDPFSHVQIAAKKAIEKINK